MSDHRPPTIHSQAYRAGLRRPSFNHRLGGVINAAKLHAIPHDERTLGLCPACGVITEPARGRLPRGGAHRVSIAPSGQAWHCKGCQAGGGAADLVSWHRFRRPVAELDRDQLRELGRHIDDLTGDMPVLPARAPYVPPPRLTPAELEQRVREADDRRWQRTLHEAALYLHELRERTGTTTEREAWRALERFEPPPTVPETAAPIVWRGQRITWPALQAAYVIQLHERRASYFAELAELELRDGGNHG
jgi:hypothetical protein